MSIEYSHQHERVEPTLESGINHGVTKPQHFCKNKKLIHAANTSHPGAMGHGAPLGPHASLKAGMHMPLPHPNSDSMLVEE